ncbi:hypothetical protein D9619_013360 [Psilocybe cf. subviscida]|uniref:FHA domain-containing protein n=1 Tax=Psilocybe cf. subviscida TaxID=2480587 RepID=A0A8H5BSE9_9AGAR|nr:hypothetical protein D9619_013360 [Psilocybe cf. subviscida]
MAPLFPSSSLSSLNPGSLTAESLGGLAPHNATVPALYLYPLNYLSPSSSASPSPSGGPSAAGGPNGVANGGSGSDTWAPKHIALTNVHMKIGRQTSSKTAPGERNGYFDSKVLSRQHAEVWEEGGKVHLFISSRLSSRRFFPPLSLVSESTSSPPPTPSPLSPPAPCSVPPPALHCLS